LTNLIVFLVHILGECVWRSLWRWRCNLVSWWCMLAGMQVCALPYASTYLYCVACIGGMPVLRLLAFARRVFLAPLSLLRGIRWVHALGRIWTHLRSLLFFAGHVLDTCPGGRSWARYCACVSCCVLVCACAYCPCSTGVVCCISSIMLQITSCSRVVRGFLCSQMLRACAGYSYGSMSVETRILCLCVLGMSGHASDQRAGILNNIWSQSKKGKEK